MLSLGWISLTGAYAQERVNRSRVAGWTMDVELSSVSLYAEGLSVGGTRMFGNGWSVGGHIGCMVQTFLDDIEYDRTPRPHLSLDMEGRWSALRRYASPFLGVRVVGTEQVGHRKYMPEKISGIFNTVSSRNLVVLPELGCDIGRVSLWAGFGPAWIWETSQQPDLSFEDDFTPTWGMMFGVTYRLF